jgi:quercetin dioxygenase-like cupin family protein
VVWIPGRVRTEIHLASQDTNGAFCVLVDYPPVGWSLPAHLHEGVAETIHNLEGEFEMTVDGRLRLTAGGTLHVPADAIHAGGNVGAVPGRRIVIFAPARMENFFLELGRQSEDTEVEPAAALACATRHGWKFVTQPPPARE